MEEATLDHALDLAMQLSPEQQEILLDILQRRKSEMIRREMAADARASLSEYRAGYLTAHSSKEIIATLHQSLDES